MKFVLDTNVISELMKPEPHEGVSAWIAARPRRSLYTVSIVQAEILHGIALLPEGKRRNALAATAEAYFVEEYAGRILSFDSKAAAHYAAISASRRSAGNPIDGFDALIAATALAVGAKIITRDSSGFESCGLTVINPWLST
jgi:predicted nucleic acid-binding protein